MQLVHFRKRYMASKTNYKIPMDLKNYLEKCTESMQKRVELLYLYGLEVVRDKIPEDEFLFILKVFAYGFINQQYPYQVRQELILPEYLNYDWEYHFIAERNFCGMGAVISSQNEGDYVLGNSHNNCCEHCKKTVDGKLFRVVHTEQRRNDFKNSIWPAMIWDLTKSKYHDEEPCRCVFTKFMREYSWIDNSGIVQFVTSEHEENTRSKWEQIQIRNGVFTRDS